MYMYIYNLLQSADNTTDFFCFSEQYSMSLIEINCPGFDLIVYPLQYQIIVS